MNTGANPSETKSTQTWVILLSIVLPLLVAALYLMPKFDSGKLGFDVHLLPAINAVINSMTTVVLLVGFWFIKQKNIIAHKRAMTTALVLSVMFLAVYVSYHAIAESTPYGGKGMARGVYYTVLLTHIILAAAIVPLVLITVVRAWSKKFDKHRKIARITLPLWLYVSISGVIVYLMISPYY